MSPAERDAINWVCPVECLVLTEVTTAMVALAVATFKSYSAEIWRARSKSCWVKPPASWVVRLTVTTL